MPATFIAVTRRFAQVQRGLALSQTIWLFIGIPIFLLFVSPGLAAFAALAARRIFARLRRVHRPAHNRWLNGRTSRAFGARLAISTALFMLLSYITGVTYELPRLWVAFLPPLTLGLVIASPLARARHGGKALNTLLFILAAQLLVTAAHWIQLDVRESEFRLTQGRFFTSLPTSSTNAPLAAAKSG